MSGNKESEIQHFLNSENKATPRCFNDGFPNCDWCVFKEKTTCPGGAPQHAEMVQRQSGPDGCDVGCFTTNTKG
jgi:hypothetical protein